MGCENSMDRIIDAYFLLCLCLMLSSCKDIEHLFLINKLNQTIIVKVTLLTEDGEQIMETRIAPNESDGWEFEIDKGGKKIIDEKLKDIVILDYKDCKKIFQRDDILKIVEKSGAWNIIIDKEVMNCN